jgi:hypothetical protein
VRIFGIMSGLFVILFAYWFFFITTVAVLAGVRKMTFTLNWWAFIFPNAGLTLATIQAGKVLNSEALNGIASALTTSVLSTAERYYGPAKMRIRQWKGLRGAGRAIGTILKQRRSLSDMMSRSVRTH